MRIRERINLNSDNLYTVPVLTSNLLSKYYVLLISEVLNFKAWIVYFDSPWGEEVSEKGSVKQTKAWMDGI